MAIKYKQIDKLIAQLTAPRSGNSGDGGGEVATVKLNGAKAKKWRIKANKKAKLRKQLAALEEDMEADKKAAFKNELAALEEDMKADKKAALKKQLSG